MGSVVQFAVGAVSADVRRAFEDADRRIAEALDSAKAAAVPQGLLVALLHGHAHAATERMVHEGEA